MTNLTYDPVWEKYLKKYYLKAPKRFDIKLGWGSIECVFVLI